MKISIAIIFTLGMIYLNNISYLLFHSFTEIAVSIIAFGTFIVASNTYQITKNHFFMFLGIGYAYVGLLSVVHAFSFESMGIIPGSSMNMAAQIWVAARTLEVTTLFLSQLFLYGKMKKLNIPLTFLFFSLLSLLFLLSIVCYDWFPDCFAAAVNHTGFKIAAEYLLSFGFAANAILFFRAKNRMNRSLYRYIEIVMLVSILSELLFSTYNIFPEFSRFSGHFLNLVSFYYLYRAIIVNGLHKPLDILIHRLDASHSRLKTQAEQRLFMKEAIARNEQCYEMIIDRSSDGLYITRNGRYLFVNPKVLEILGAREPAEVLGKSIYETVHPDCYDQLHDRLRMMSEDASIMPIAEYKFNRFDGKTIFVECVSSRIIYKGEWAVLTMVRDISDKKQIMVLESDIRQTEEKLNRSNEYNRMLAEFFANISHELKTPLNIILGTIQLQQQEQCCRHTGMIKQNCYRLMRILKNLIDLSQIDTSYLSLKRRNLNIVQLTEDITLSAARYAEQRGVQIVFDTDTEEKIAAVDADEIERILLNLLSNAIKFTDRGGEIAVTVQDKGGIVSISVKDTGIGIPADKLEVIFDRFGQVDRSKTRNREGSGIGLALVRKLVEMHGGTIRVNSQLGHGSEFLIDLPVRFVEGDDLDFEDRVIDYSKTEKIDIEFSDIYSI